MPNALECDVAVVGLGAMGALTLWRLARRPGVRAVGVEQFQPGHDRGASHGESRIFRTAYMEGAAYVPLMRHARRLWAELERETGAALLTSTGCLNIGPRDSQPVAGAARSAAAHGLPHELLDRAALAARFPQHADLPADTVALYEREAGFLRPEAAVRAAVAAAAARGATVLAGSPAAELLSGPDGIRVRLADREVVAGHVVLAGGGWTGRFLPELSARLRVVRRVQAWFPARDPADFAPARFPVFLRGTEGRTWYGIPSVDGRTVKVAVHQWPGVDEPVRPDAGPRPPDPADAALVADLVARALPGLDPTPTRMAACSYTLTPDEHFLVGPHRDRPGITVLAGFSGHGFKFAPVIGEAAAALAATGRTTIPIGLFDPHRFDRDA